MADFHMWSYWRDKRGSPVQALRSDYPEVLERDPTLQAAVAQIRMAELAINARMEDLERFAEDCGDED